MKEEIYNLIKNSKAWYDGIDIAHLVKGRVDLVYAALYELEQEGKIKKDYVDLNTYYTLV